ncbi:MAG: fibrobacter succinogenes major paralogous domain-containing protein, partial [Chitinispirillales bacterium]|nr:fibrobacter succinogenes major paralogous domain-containing protein [Chitinispirillales bacterium]
MDINFTDPRDGHIYRTVKIGGQTWMAENLNYKTENSWCYDNDESNGKKYGRLYTWETAQTVCPSGWHLPSREEWGNLVEAAGGYKVAGKKLKSKTGWDDRDDGTSGNGTDEFGFSALPGGYRVYSDGSFYYVGYYGYWWSATEYGSGDADNRDMGYNYDYVGENYDGKSNGFSVRC